MGKAAVPALPGALRAWGPGHAGRIQDPDHTGFRNVRVLPLPFAGQTTALFKLTKATGKARPRHSHRHWKVRAGAPAAEQSPPGGQREQGRGAASAHRPVSPNNGQPLRGCRPANGEQVDGHHEPRCAVQREGTAPLWYSRRDAMPQPRCRNHPTTQLVCVPGRARRAHTGPGQAVPANPAALPWTAVCVGARAGAATWTKPCRPPQRPPPRGRQHRQSQAGAVSYRTGWKPPRGLMGEGASWVPQLPAFRPVGSLGRHGETRALGVQCAPYDLGAGLQVQRGRSCSPLP